MVFYRYSVTTTHSLRSLSAFLLCNAGHDCEAEFRVWFKRYNAIGLKINAYTSFQQFTCILQAVHGISRKSADFFRDDQIKLMFIPIPDHLGKLFSFFDRSTRNAFIPVASVECPIGICFDHVIVVANLRTQAVKLHFFIRTDSSVKCNNQRKIYQAGSPSQHLFNFIYTQVSEFICNVTSREVGLANSIRIVYLFVDVIIYFSFILHRNLLQR